LAFAVHRSPFGVWRSPFTVHRSPFTVRRSPFAVHRSPFAVRRSPFAVRRSAGAVRKTTLGTEDEIGDRSDVSFLGLKSSSWSSSLAIPERCWSKKLAD
jgi:hypothetical protein